MLISINTQYFTNIGDLLFIINETDLQPVLKPVEQVHYFEGWGVSAKSTLCP